MRLFAALEIPYEIVEEINAWWQEASLHLMPGDWRDVPTRNWHLTLAFYGDVEGGEADDLAESLMNCARQTQPVQLRTTAFGAFPGFLKPRVLWAGVADFHTSRESKKLARCCRQAGRVTVRKRSAKERPFTGHITLARARELPVAIDNETLDELPEFPELQWTAESLTLYQSRLHPDGVKYRRLETIRLG